MKGSVFLIRGQWTTEYDGYFRHSWRLNGSSTAASLALNVSYIITAKTLHNARTSWQEINTGNWLGSLGCKMDPSRIIRGRIVTACTEEFNRCCETKPRMIGKLSAASHWLLWLVLSCSQSVELPLIIMWTEWNTSATYCCLLKAKWAIRVIRKGAQGPNVLVETKGGLLSAVWL